MRRHSHHAFGPCAQAFPQALRPWLADVELSANRAY